MPNAPFLAPERDNDFKKARAKTSGGTVYYEAPGILFYNQSTLTVNAGRDYYALIFVDTPIVVDQLAFEVTTGSAGNARVGLYSATTDSQPTGAPVADSGNIDVTSTGVKTYTPGTALFLRRGRYLTVFNSSSTPGIRFYSGSGNVLDTMGAGMVSAFYVDRAYAAFPTPGTAWTNSEFVATNPRSHPVVLRVSQP